MWFQHSQTHFLNTGPTLEGIKKKIPLPTHSIVPRLLVNRVRMVENKKMNKKKKKKKEDEGGLTACLDMVESLSHRL